MENKIVSWAKRHKMVTTIGLGIWTILIFSVVISALSHANLNLATKNTSATKPAPKAKPVVTGPLPNLTNTSTQNDDPTNNFVVTAKWGIEWTYDCTNDNPPGNFYIAVQNPDGSANTNTSDVHTKGVKGNGVQQESLAGTYQLHIIVDPACTWHVQVVNNSAPTTVSDAPVPAKPKPAPTTAQQVTSWYNQYGSNITNLTNDFSKMSQEGTDSTAVEATCTQIFDDAVKAQAVPAIPDSSANISWQAALSSYISAAQDCQDGVTNSDVTLISQATTEFSQGNASLTATASAIQKLKQ